MAVGEIFLAAFLQVLVEKLLSPESINFAGGEGLARKLDQWRETLRRIQAVLHDAEERQHTEGAVIKQWLDDLRDLAYDVEDILDEFTTEALLRKLKGKDEASTSKVRKLIPACCTGFSPSALKLNFRLGSKIHDITARFNNIVTLKDQLNLKGTTDHGRSNRRGGTLVPTSVMTDAYVYGREKDKDVLLELLLGERRSDAQVSVIPILGMGGIGKTTLAQLLFNDENVQRFFDLKAWACVSQDFNVVKVTKLVLKSITPESCDDDDLNLLQVKLKEKLQGKKFLVVLDDLWNENYHDWTILCAPFLVGAPGSTIVITARNEGVSLTSSVTKHRLEVLSKDACLSVFTQHALGASNFNAHPDLQEIGEKLVERCKGLPLAAKTLGGLLCTKKNRNEWVDVLKSNIWDIPEERSGIVPALMLSYYHLPSHLKRCFMYCSILPEDYEFEEQQLVLLWIADGLIHTQQGEENMQMEDLGRQYFRELLSRSFFQQSNIKESQFKNPSQYSSNHSSTKKPRFVMHDLIHDLAQLVAGDICFKMEDRIGGRNGRRLSIKARYSSYLPGQFEIAKKFEPFVELKCLRAFLPIQHLERCVLHQLLPKLLGLRALSLSGYCISELPDSIGDLKHLRYLDLSNSWIRGLTKSTTTLCNLQTMILEGCRNLKKLPSNLANLVNLRHLNILGAYQLKGMPPQIGKLTHLQTLSNLIVGEGSCSTLRELGSLLHLQGTLIISQLENATEPRDASDAKLLIDKTDLTTLCLEWSFNKDDSEESEFDVLSMLQPHNDLKELTIRRYGGTKFPTWFGHSLLHMVLLRIENCKKCTSLPPVGQLPSLKQLFIGGMASVKDVDVEFYGEGSSQPFRSLVTLHFKDMAKWEKWSPNGEFPHLRELSITNCSKLLGELPNHFPTTLQQLEISNCGKLVSITKSEELPASLQQLKISLCVQLESIAKSFHHNSSLEYISISNCENLKSLPTGIHTLSHLDEIYIYGCPTLASFPDGGLLPSNLRKLWITGDMALPNCIHNLTSLQKLYIWRRNSPNVVSVVSSFSEEGFPANLTSLSIENCNFTQALLEWGLHRLTSLKLLEIKGGCPNVESFPEKMLPASLTKLWISWFPNLKYMSSLQSLTSLQQLDIEECENLTSFPEDGLPPSLQELYIQRCPLLKEHCKKDQGREWSKIAHIPCVEIDNMFVFDSE